MFSCIQTTMVALWRNGRFCYHCIERGPCNCLISHHDLTAFLFFFKVKSRWVLWLRYLLESSLHQFIVLVLLLFCYLSDNFWILFLFFLALFERYVFALNLYDVKLIRVSVKLLFWRINYSLLAINWLANDSLSLLCSSFNTTALDKPVVKNLLFNLWRATSEIWWRIMFLFTISRCPIPSLRIDNLNSTLGFELLKLINSVRFDVSRRVKVFSLETWVIERFIRWNVA